MTNIPNRVSMPSTLREAVNQTLDMPWAARNEVRRLLFTPFYSLLFRIHGIQWGHGWRIYGMPIIQRFRSSQIVIGDYVEMRSWKSSNPLVPYHPVALATRSKEAVIKIGQNVGLASSILVAAERIEIGDRVNVGANVIITDFDFHPLSPAERAKNINAGKREPVYIEDEVFIGMNSIVLKGVRISRGSVIGAGSVVTQDIPAYKIAAGNPARVVGEVQPGV